MKLSRTPTSFMSHITGKTNIHQQKDTGN